MCIFQKYTYVKSIICCMVGRTAWFLGHLKATNSLWHLKTASDRISEEGA